MLPKICNEIIANLRDCHPSTAKKSSYIIVSRHHEYKTLPQLHDPTYIETSIVQQHRWQLEKSQG